MEGTFKLTVSQICHIRFIESSQQKQHGKNSAVLSFNYSKMYRGQGTEYPNLSLSDPSLAEMCFPDLFCCDAIPLMWRADHMVCPMELTVVSIMGMLAHYLTLCSLYEAPQEKFLSDFSTKKSCNSLEQ